MATQPYIIRVRRGTEAQWSLVNPVLSDGEPGYITDNNLYKIGDGVTLWNDLPYTTGIIGPQGPQGLPGEGALVEEGTFATPPAGLEEGEFLYDPNAEPDPGFTAITQDQADARYVNADGDTMTGPLNMTVSIPLNLDAPSGQYAVMRTKRSGVSTFYMGQDVTADQFRLYGYASGKSVYLLTEDGSVVLSSATAVRVPAPTAANHAAQVTAIDPTTGRLAIGGVEIGDTGLRVVSTLLETDWTIAAPSTVNRATLRRTGNVVEFFMRGNAVPASPTNSLVISLPAGFQGDSNRGRYLPITSVNNTGGVTLDLGSLTVKNYPPTGSVYWTVTWITDDPWPTSLPGTAA